MKVNEVIRRLREDKGLTQQNIADELGVENGTVIRWEKGGNIKSENLERIAKVLGVTVTDIYSYSENPTLLNEPLAAYNTHKVQVLVQLDGTTNTLNAWVSTLKKLNAAL
jgi:transcriptional regulator with XRE-family HTH domain